MADTKFIALLPQKMQIGDQIRLKCTLIDNATEFSINFVNEACQAPQNISYHMKWFINANILVENFKRNGQWINHKETSINSFYGNEMNLEFIAQEDENTGTESIWVYVLSEYGASELTNYEFEEFSLNDIQSFQIWGDVAKVNELSFVYK